MASTACAPVINGVVRLLLMVPPAATANEMAVILSLFGTSAMRMKPKSPKQYHAPTSLPPTASHAWRPSQNCAASSRRSEEGAVSGLLHPARLSQRESRSTDLVPRRAAPPPSHAGAASALWRHWRFQRSEN